MASPQPLNIAPAEQGKSACPCWIFAALALSLVGAVGGLLLTWMEGLTACTLCFYQRVFMLSCLGILTLGVLVRDLRPGRASLFALPSAMGGFAVAVFHVNLEMNGKLECPTGLLGMGTAPVQSLIAFGLLMGLLGGDLVEARKAGYGIPAIGLGAALLGLFFAIALIFSGPPLPVYSEDAGFQKRFKYQGAPVECRPPKPAA